MKRENKIRALIKFAFWSVLSCAFLCLAFYLHKSGKFAEWFYFRASEDGYAINALSIMDATVEKPIALAVGQFDRIDGDRAVRVRKGDRLPVNANGVITDKVLKESEQAVFEGAYVLVKIPWKMQDAKGFKYKDTFKHKGVETYPVAAIYNVLLVIGLSISLGFMAEGFTDLLGVRIDKIQHFEGS